MKNKLLLIIFLCVNILSINNIYSQDIEIKGYVIKNKEICPNVLITVLHKKISTKSNRNGKFKISCQINDTLRFDAGEKNIPLSYVVKDSSFVIFELSNIMQKEYDCKEFYSCETYSVKQISYFNYYNIQYSRILDKRLFQSVGISFFSTFSNQDFSSYNLGFGLNYYNSDFNDFLFPFINVKLDLGFNNLYFSRIKYLSLNIPEFKFGYSIYSQKYQNNNGLGIIISSTFFKFHFTSFSVKMNVSFEKLNSNKGLFALGLNLNYQKYKNYNNLNRRIKFVNK